MALLLSGLGVGLLIFYNWGDPHVDERMILRWIFKNLNLGVETGLGWLRIETGGRLL
jgi:hypothetical protein